MGKCETRGDGAAKTVKPTTAAEPKKSRCGGGAKTKAEPKKK